MHEISLCLHWEGNPFRVQDLTRGLLSGVRHISLNLGGTVFVCAKLNFSPLFNAYIIRRLLTWESLLKQLSLCRNGIWTHLSISRLTAGAICAAPGATPSTKERGKCTREFLLLDSNDFLLGVVVRHDQLCLCCWSRAGIQHIRLIRTLSLSLSILSVCPETSTQCLFCRLAMSQNKMRFYFSLRPHFLFIGAPLILTIKRLIVCGACISQKWSFRCVNWFSDNLAVPAHRGMSWTAAPEVLTGWEMKLLLGVRCNSRVTAKAVTVGCRIDIVCYKKARLYPYDLYCNFILRHKHIILIISEANMNI